MEKKEKKLYLEIMRIFACFFVIFNHTSHDGFFLFSQRTWGSAHFFIEMVPAVFCKFAVPLFFAVSGALLLQRESEPLSVTWKKRILRIVIIIFASSALYYGWACYLEGKPFQVWVWLINTYHTQISSHLWYLYAYVAFLISLPLLQSFAKSLENQYFYYIGALVIFFSGILPCIEYVWNKGEASLNTYLSVSWLCSTIVCYPLCGYFLEHRFTGYQSKKKMATIWALNAIGIGLTCYMVYYQALYSGELNDYVSQGFFECFVLLNCVAVYTSIKAIFENRNMPHWLEKWILSMGKCTFGIYLIHWLVKDLKVMKDMLSAFQKSPMPDMLAAWLYCLIVFFVCYGIIWILKWIPGLNKLL